MCHTGCCHKHTDTILCILTPFAPLAPDSTHSHTRQHRNAPGTRPGLLQGVCLLLCLVIVVVRVTQQAAQCSMHKQRARFV